MAYDKFTILKSTAVPMPIENVDTDQIIPARFLKATKREGFGDNLLHRVGHGIGMGGHEGPWVAEGSDDVLEENMIISIEPGLYWRGQGGYRHSDTVLITSDGYRKLTDFSRDINAMTLV